MVRGLILKIHAQLLKRATQAVELIHEIKRITARPREEDRRQRSRFSQHGLSLQPNAK